MMVALVINLIGFSMFNGFRSFDRESLLRDRDRE